MTRQIVLDTETTGLCRDKDKNPSFEHRIIEIAALEMIDGTLTGKKFHSYISNPITEISEEAFKIHGITEEFLIGKPEFRDIVNDFLDFVLGSTLIIHNAKFDIDFLDKELWFCELPFLGRFLNPAKKFICTQEMSDGLSLDKFCAKYGIDTSARKLHGALIDAELCAMCYLAMIGKGDGPRILRSSVNECLDEFYQKHKYKEEGVLIQEIKARLECMA